MYICDVTFFPEKGSSSDEEHVKEEDKKPNEEVQIDSKLNDFFKVCISICKSLFFSHEFHTLGVHYTRCIKKVDL